MAKAADLRKKFTYPEDYESLGLCSHAAIYVNKEEIDELRSRCASDVLELLKEIKELKDHIKHVEKIALDRKFTIQRLEQEIVDMDDYYE